MTVLWEYLNNDRSYHTLLHPGEMLRDLEIHFPEFSEDMVLKYAIAYHDCRYDAGAQSNEFHSAHFAVSELWDILDDEELNDLHDLIMVTKKHLPIEDYRSKIIIDLDLRGLASDPDKYKQNSLNVRKEFFRFSDSEWREGRMKWLTEFLSRDSIYHTDTGLDLWEQRAQFNLHAEYTYLKSVNDGN